MEAQNCELCTLTKGREAVEWTQPNTLNQVTTRCTGCLLGLNPPPPPPPHPLHLPATPGVLLYSLWTQYGSRIGDCATAGLIAIAAPKC